MPSTIGDLENLTNLVLSSNQLTNNIPAETGNLTKLIELELGSNRFTDVPAEIEYFTKLTDLQIVSSSELTGTIPSFIGNLTNLQILNLSSNKLTGEIPSQLGNLTKSVNTNGLYQTRLNLNQLTGTVPQGILNNNTFTSQWICTQYQVGSTTTNPNPFTNYNCP